MKYLVNLLMLLLLSSAPLPGLAQEVQSAWHQNDPRLNKQITYTSERIALSELLAELSKLSGVRMVMDDDSIEAGIEVAVVFKAVPVGKALDSVRALFSFKNLEWRCIQTKLPGGYSYRLAPYSIMQLRAHWNEAGVALFKNYFTIMTEFLQLTPEERKRQVKMLTRALGAKNDMLATIYVDDKNIGGMERMKFTLDLAGNHLDELINTGKFFIPYSNLDDRHKEIADKFYQQDGGPSRKGIDSKPDIIEFWDTRKFNQSGTIGLSITMSVTGDAYANYFGAGLNVALDDLVREAWRSKGSQLSHPFEKIKSEKTESSQSKAVSDDPDSPPPFLTKQTRIVKKLMTVSDVDPVSVAIVVPQNLELEYIKPLGKRTVEEFFKESSLLHKWQNDILLVNTIPWFLYYDDVIPPSQIRILRQKLNRQNGLLTLDQLAELSRTLTDVQWTGLLKRFPLLETVHRFLPIFQLTRDYPGLLSSSGMELTDPLLFELKRIFNNPPPAYLKDWKMIRLSASDSSPNRVKYRHVNLEVRKATGLWETFALTKYRIVMQAEQKK